MPWAELKASSHPSLMNDFTHSLGQIPAQSLHHPHRPHSCSCCRADARAGSQEWICLQLGRSRHGQDDGKSSPTKRREVPMAAALPTPAQEGHVTAHSCCPPTPETGSSWFQSSSGHPRKRSCGGVNQLPFSAKDIPQGTQHQQKLKTSLSRA